MAILKYDVVIIGGGLSGSMAALHAASLGKKVAVVQKAWGSTALGSGAFEIAYDEDSYDILSGISKIKTKNFFHPYHYLNTENLSQAMELLKKWLPIRIQGSYTENHLFLNDQGMYKKAAFALETQFLDFKAIARKRILALGFEGILDGADGAAMGPPPRSHGGVGKLQRQDPRRLDLLESNDVNVLPQTLAKRFDHPEEIRKLAQALKSKFPLSQYDVLLLPPILGLDFFSDMKRELESYVGIPVYELLGSMNSVAGIRFQKALEAALRKAGISLVSGKVVSFSNERKKIFLVNCHSEPEGRGISIEASQFILAAGKFISGGLYRNAHGFKETVFDLPLFYQDKKINNEPVRQLLKESYQDFHPVFQCGVKVNDYLIPLNEFNEPVYENLRACGTILQGFDPYQEGTRFGVQILSGYKAGDV